MNHPIASYPLIALHVSSRESCIGIWQNKNLRGKCE